MNINGNIQQSNANLPLMASDPEPYPLPPSPDSSPSIVAVTIFLNKSPHQPIEGKNSSKFWRMRLLERIGINESFSRKQTISDCQKIYEKTEALREKLHNTMVQIAKDLYPSPINELESPAFERRTSLVLLLIFAQALNAKYPKRAANIREDMFKLCNIVDDWDCICKWHNDNISRKKDEAGVVAAVMAAEKAFESIERLDDNDYRKKTCAFQKIANILLLKNLKAADQAIEKAIENAEKVPDPIDRSSYFSLIAEHLDKNHPEKAFEFHEKAWNSADMCENPMDKGNAFVEILKVFLRINKDKSWEFIKDKAGELIDKIESLDCKDAARLELFEAFLRISKDKSWEFIKDKAEELIDKIESLDYKDKPRLELFKAFLQINEDKPWKFIKDKAEEFIDKIKRPASKDRVLDLMLEAWLKRNPINKDKPRESVKDEEKEELFDKTENSESKNCARDQMFKTPLNEDTIWEFGKDWPNQRRFQMLLEYNQQYNAEWLERMKLMIPKLNFKEQNQARLDLAKKLEGYDKKVEAWTLFATTQKAKPPPPAVKTVDFLHECIKAMIRADQVKEASDFLKVVLSQPMVLGGDEPEEKARIYWMLSEDCVKVD